LILCAEKDSWFNYYWWEEVKKAPEFVFNVDIHRKPGYDPLELFLDPQTKRISQDTSLIKGSHGIIESQNTEELPIFGMSFEAKKSENLIKINQVAPTISKFFHIDSNLAGTSLI